MPGKIQDLHSTSRRVAPADALPSDTTSAQPAAVTWTNWQPAHTRHSDEPKSRPGPPEALTHHLQGEAADNGQPGPKTMAKRMPNHAGNPPLRQGSGTDLPIRSLWCAHGCGYALEVAGPRSLDKLLLDTPQEATCHAGSCEVYGYGAAGGHWSQVVELTPELSRGEAFRQTPHLPEGWVQGSTYPCKRRALSTYSFPAR